MRNAVLFLAFVAGAAFCGSALAQSCNSAITSTFSAGGTVSGNSCQASSTLSNFCQNADPLNGAGVAVYGMVLGTNNTGVQVSVTSAAFNPYLAVQKPDVVNGCTSSDQCVSSTQNVGTSTITVPNGSAAGTYYIVVGDTDTDSPGCGAFNLTVSGTLPVKLQKFSVK
jgi:hypothetical protein